MSPTVMTIYGTRPEAIKVAPVILALEASDTLRSVAVTTGQHREMLEQVNRLFQLHPTHDLDVFDPGQGLSRLASRALARLEPVFDEVAPDAVLVQGDTTTAFIGALAAFYGGVPVVHLEAGLRSGHLHSPFPEEGNRRLISQVAALHLAPTPTARGNLLREGIEARDVAVTGNTVIDALHHVTARHIPFSVPLLRQLEVEGRPIVLVTVHRRESWGEPLECVGRAVRKLASAFPGHAFVLPLHLNPLVRRSMLPHLDEVPNAFAIDPLGYADFARLMGISHLVVTDSGGVQEEAPSLGKPVLVLRDNTERPEAVAAGTVKLIGTDEGRIFDEAANLLNSSDEYARMANAVNPYGDGLAAARSVAAIAELLGRGRRLPDFSAESSFGSRASRSRGRTD